MRANSCTDNWTLKHIRVPTIGDTIDCQDTYVKVRVFICIEY